MFAVTFAKLTFLLCAYLYVLVYVCVFHNGTQSTFIYFNPLTHNVPKWSDTQTLQDF